MRTDEILANVPGKPEVDDYEKIVDDVIQWSGDLKTAFFRVCGMLSHCARSGMVFSAPKFVFGAKEVEYVNQASLLLFHQYAVAFFPLVATQISKNLLLIFVHTTL